jgi:hypothetical protein
MRSPHWRRAETSTATSFCGLAHARSACAATPTHRSRSSTTAQIALTEAQHAVVLPLMVADAAAPVPLVDNMDIPLGTPAGRLFRREPWVEHDPVSQLLAILYASASGGINQGGFFPAGLNGRITD